MGMRFGSTVFAFNHLELWIRKLVLSFSSYPLKREKSYVYMLHPSHQVVSALISFWTTTVDLQNNSLFKIVLLFIIDLESPCYTLFCMYMLFRVNLWFKVSESAFESEKRFPCDFALSCHGYAPLFMSQSSVVGTKTHLAIIFLSGILGKTDK